MALVRFRNVEDSFNAIANLHNEIFSGRKMQISFTKSKVWSQVIYLLVLFIQLKPILNYYSSFFPWNQSQLKKPISTGIWPPSKSRGPSASPSLTYNKCPLWSTPRLSFPPTFYRNLESIKKTSRKLKVGSKYLAFYPADLAKHYRGRLCHKFGVTSQTYKNRIPSIYYNWKNKLIFYAYGRTTHREPPSRR